MNTLKDFYYFYKEIPEEKWCEGSYEENGACCFYGHLGERDHNYGNELTKKINGLLKFTPLCALPVNVNDGIDVRYPQLSPKQRVLAFLIDKIKEKEDSTFNG